MQNIELWRNARNTGNLIEPTVCLSFINNAGNPLRRVPALFIARFFTEELRTEG